MDAFTSFLSMGGHGEFIWPAYAIVTAVLAGLWVMSRRSLRDAERTLEKLSPHEESPLGEG
jgi:heme exporter protein CcmD